MQHRELVFDDLPRALQLRVFALLPLHSRLLLVFVCRGWRALGATPCLWPRRIDLSPLREEHAVRLSHRVTSLKRSLTWPSQSDAILRGACARTGNTVVRFDV